MSNLINDDTPESKGPRIPLSMLAMGASVIITLTLHWATFEKRVSVTERALVIAELERTKLETSNTLLISENLKKDGRINLVEHTIDRLEKEIEKLQDGDKTTRQ